MNNDIAEMPAVAYNKSALGLGKRQFMLRNSPLFQFTHGDHICVFYRSQEYLQSVLVPYVSEGLRKGERCFCAQKIEVITMLVHGLQFLGFDTDRAQATGALELHTVDEVYFPSGTFEPDRLMALLMRSIDQSVKKGFSGFRSAGELSWACKDVRTCDQLAGYEAMVNQNFPGKPATGMCQYSMDDFNPVILERVLAHHRLHMEDRAHYSVHASVDVNYADYAAEIVAERLMVDPKFYYVVRKHRPAGVVAWGTATSFVHAMADTEIIIRSAVTN
jgi:hypothetical protein